MKEYQDFLERLKFLIANSNVGDIPSNKEKPVTDKEYPDFFKYLNFIIADRSKIAKHRIRKHRKCSPTVKETELSKK